MAAIDAAKHMISYTAGSTPGARRDTLKGDGPLTVAAGHFFAVVLQRAAGAGGAVSLTYREVEFLLGECFTVSDDFRELHNGWAIRVDVRCSQLLADADAAGLLDCGRCAVRLRWCRSS